MEIQKHSIASCLALDEIMKGNLNWHTWLSRIGKGRNLTPSFREMFFAFNRCRPLTIMLGWLDPGSPNLFEGANICQIPCWF